MASEFAQALVIGGAGAVGEGVVEALRGAGREVVVVDPQAVESRASRSTIGQTADTPGLAARLGDSGHFDLVVISLPARGEGRDEGEFRPAALAAEALPQRLSALELAVEVLGESGGTLIELAGGAALEPGHDEAGLIGGWQRGVHRGFESLENIRAFLCAIATPVKSRRLAGDGEAWPTAREIGGRLLELVASNRSGGLCIVATPDFEVSWPEVGDS
jgi:hypothetical protein